LVSIYAPSACATCWFKPDAVSTVRRARGFSLVNVVAAWRLRSTRAVRHCAWIEPDAACLLAALFVLTVPESWGQQRGSCITSVFSGGVRPTHSAVDPPACRPAAAL